MNYRVTILVAFTLAVVSQRGIAQIQISDQEERTDRIGSSILNDTTEQIYGPTTTRFTYEGNIKYNNPEYWFIDTSVVDLHKYQYVVKKQYQYQDLGNIGTAMAPIYPQIPQRIGATSGFNVYNPYHEGPGEVKYYDSRSPFSRFGVIWGGQGRSITEATYTRNIDERSNIGFDFRGIFTDKQIQRTGRGDRQVEGIYYRLFGKYRTRDGKYYALGNFIRNRHQVNENGGIDITDGAEDLSVYFDENRQVNLTTVETEDFRTNYHLYHQYKLNDIVQLYHSLDRYKQQNDFRDAAEQPDSSFYDFFEVDSVQANDRSKMVYVLNEVGMKGDIGKTFYNFYYKRRNVNFDYKYLFSSTLGFETDYVENYAGFNLRFGNDSVSYISASGEYMLGGEYKLGGEIRNSWFYAKLLSSRYKPSYIQRAYRGSHDYWVNDFDSPISSSLSSGLRVKLGPVTLLPSAEYNLLTNYIYFRKFDVQEGQQSVLPTQAQGDISVLKGNVGLAVRFMKVFNLKANVIYTNVSGSSAEAVRVPEIFGNAQLSYHNILFDGNLEWQIGVDAHMKTPYFAMGYDPAIMQYYVQDDFEVPSFPVMDIFINAKINRVRFFLKYNNLVQVMRGTGYFLTPGYPAQDAVFDFGFHWPFYD